MSQQPPQDVLRRTTVAIRRRGAASDHPQSSVTPKFARVLVSSRSSEGTAAAHSSEETTTHDEPAEALPPRNFYPALSCFRSHCVLLLPLLLAGLLYSNSLHGNFVYDDHYALVDNPDTNPHASFLPLLYHDYWGAPLASNSSHKSFRPFTVWSWRMTRSLVELIVGQDAVQPIEGVHIPYIHPSAWKDWFIALATLDDSRTKSPPATPSSSTVTSVLITQPYYSFLFHVQNVLLHIYCTFLVYVVAFSLFSLRVSRDDTPRTDEESAAIPDDHMFRRRSIFLAFIAALLFAAHPIHTEAVSGIVGHAELLSCAWFLMAFLCWFWSNLLITSADEARGGIGVGLRALCTNLALVGFLTATLCKEIAITLVAVFVCLDLVHAAMILSIGGIALPPPHSKVDSRGRRVSTSPSGIGGSPPVVATSTWCFHLFSLVWPRFLLLGIVSTFYLVWRRLLAGATFGVGHEVFRKIENPLAFEPSAWTRALTLVNMHGKYAELLIAPWNLCCDYSLNCLPVVHSILDLRWTRGLFAYLVVFGAFGVTVLQLMRILNTKRLDTMRLVYLSAGYAAPPVPRRTPGYRTSIVCWLETTPSWPFHATEGWHLNLNFYSSVFLSLGLLIFPFLPSSNVFFYVGTYVAERVLYTPSVGLSLLLALLFERLLFSGLTWTEAVADVEEMTSVPASVAPALTPTAAPSPTVLRRSDRSVSHNRTSLLIIPFIVLLLYFSSLTYTRNSDWRSEDALFSSAYSVCPTSIKVLLNIGIMQRRTLAYNSALAIFQKIPRIDPTFCETDFWIALTRINLGNVPLGMKLLKQSLGCVFTRTQALSALHRLFEELLKHSAEDEVIARKQMSVAITSDDAIAALAIAKAAFRSEYELLGEWGEIMHLVDQGETSAKYSIHAGTLCFSAANYTYAELLFQRAYDTSRALVYDNNGRLVNRPTAYSDDLGLDEDEGDPLPNPTIFTSRNYRCSAEYWLGRTLLMQDHQMAQGSRVLRALVTEIASHPHGQCTDFRLRALDHLSDYATRELQAEDDSVDPQDPPPASAATDSNDKDGVSASTSKQKSWEELLIPSSPTLAARHSEGHALLAFVLANLGKDVTAAQHYHAAAHLIDQAAENIARSIPEGAPLAADVSSTGRALSASARAARLKAIEYFRLSLLHDSTIDRARYSLAIILVETGSVEEGVSLLLVSGSSSDLVVRERARVSLKMLYSTYGPGSAIAVSLKRGPL